jgi:RNA polymerase sigma-70 factor (ECF subfamily)
MAENKKIAFMKLYEPVHEKFERFCKARVYGQLDYKDLMHDTIVIAYNKFDTIKEPKAFLHFLFGVAIRILSNNSKKKSLDYKENLHQLECITNEKTDVERTIELEHLKIALSRLPEDQRETLLLFEIVGFSIKEISHLQQIGESAVKQRLSRGRQNLLQILSPKSINF